MSRPRRTFCNHYRAMFEHDTCEVGVPYKKFKELALVDMPCFCTRGEPKPSGCELAVYATDEELAALDAEMNKRFEAIGNAREAIVKHLGGPWKRGTPDGSGMIECPNCKGNLRFTRAGYNGHIHATCSTTDCVNWME